jgi:hypothetical protein
MKISARSCRLPRSLSAYTALPPGPWDEDVRLVWAGCAEASGKELIPVSVPEQERPAILQSPLGQKLGVFAGKPSPAARPLPTSCTWMFGGAANLALDPGTYQYNAPPPWENALNVTRVHNTVMVDGQDQMIPSRRSMVELA